MWTKPLGILALSGLAVLLLLLDLAAIHDIWVGEPNPWQEWAFIALSIPLWWLLLRSLLRLHHRRRGTA